jgi:hypothetical protein
MTAEGDVADNAPEFAAFFAASPREPWVKTAQDVKLAFMLGAKDYFMRHYDLKVAFRAPTGRGRYRLVKIGPKGGETNIGLGANMVEAVIDAEARQKGAKNR